MSPSERGEVVWTPSPERIAGSALHQFARTVLEGPPARPDARQAAAEYDALWRWSVEDVGRFWTTLTGWFDPPRSGSASPALVGAEMPDVSWFPELELNYAEVCLRGHPDEVCLIGVNEAGRHDSWTRSQLANRVAHVAGGLRGLGVEAGDRVAGYLPNTPEAVVVMLAAASIGAVWSCCPPEFGEDAILDRFRQIRPSVLVAADGYQYRGKIFERRPVVDQIRRCLPEVRTTVWVDNIGGSRPEWATPFSRLEASDPVPPRRLPFNHPLWILYSSGTTGVPKAIVHGHGGTVLEQLKAHALHANLGPTSRFFQNTSIGWTMWNMLVSALAVGTSILTYDGAADFGGADALWSLCERHEVTDFGVGAAFLSHCMNRGQRPAQQHDLRRLRSIGSTGAALPAEGYRWVYAEVADDVHLRCNSGGTEVCSGLLGSAPILAVRAGELQCRPLGVRSAAFDPSGQALFDTPGELVVTEPMPSMPLRLWGDTDGRRYRDSYFDTYPGIWRHGDWVTMFGDGYSIVHGRSDATLNRDGVRIGTAELYRVLEEQPGVVDSLVVDLSDRDPSVGLLLLAVPGAGSVPEAMARSIKEELRAKASPRHVPDRIEWVPALPRTLNGKRIEVPIKRILQGTPVNQAINQESLDHPESLQPLLSLLEARLAR